MADSTTQQHGHGVTPQRIMGLSFAFAAPLFLQAGVENGIFDALDKQPLTADEVSAATGASPRGVRALLSGLVAYEVLHRSADGRYSLAADTSAFLVSSKPGYHGGIVSHLAKDLIPNWLSLSEIVRTGKPSAEVNQQEGGAEFFEHFVESLFPMGYPAGTALAGSLGVAESSQPIKVLDIAAGSGVWGIALAQASPNVTITAVDWPNVLGVTRRVAERLGLGDRLTGIPGDIQEVDLGSGYNIATLGHILHSEGEARSRRLLRRVFDALAPGGTIAIAEFMVNEERTGPPVSLIFASNMLVNTDDGDTFTLTEMTAWLAEAGFVDVRTLAAPGPSPLVLATRP